MSEQTNADLIAEANKLLAENQWTSDWGVEPLAERLAEALEAAEERAEEAVLQRNHAYRQRDEQREAKQGNIAALNRITEERDALAAVVEKVRAEVEGESGWFRHRAGRVLDILATAPADALREVKAEVWDEGFDVGYEDQRNRDTGVPMPRNPYREEQGR